jgi:hypothetical protein
VVDRTGWLSWLRALPRASVLVFCGVLLAGVVAVLGVLGAPVWTRVASAVLVAGVAAASELDKLGTRRREQNEAEQEAQRTRAAAEVDWQRRVHDCLRVWPAPPVGSVDPHGLGVAHSQLAERYAVAGGSLPPYVDRDIDPRAANACKRAACC